MDWPQWIMVAILSVSTFQTFRKYIGNDNGVNLAAALITNAFFFTLLYAGGYFDAKNCLY